MIGICSFLAPVFLGGLLWPCEREPGFHGHTLTYWLQKSMNPDTEAEAALVIRQIGTNAVPWLTRWLIYRPSTIRLKLNETAGRLREKLRHCPIADSPSYSRHALASEGFYLLGPDASSAVPGLIEYLVSNSGNDNILVFDALRSIGEESLPPLISLVTNVHNPKRLRLDALCWVLRTRAFSEFAASNFVESVKSKDPELALSAAYTLSRETTAPELVLPILTGYSRDTNWSTRAAVAKSMGEYGVKARSAVRFLIELLEDPQEEVRIEATNSVYYIDRTLLPEGTRPSQRID